MGELGIALISFTVGIFCYFSPYRWWLKIPGYAKVDSRLWDKAWFCSIARIMYGRQKMEEMRTECFRALGGKG